VSKVCVYGILSINWGFVLWILSQGVINARTSWHLSDYNEELFDQAISGSNNVIETRKRDWKNLLILMLLVEVKNLYLNTNVSLENRSEIILFRSFSAFSFECYNIFISGQLFDACTLQTSNQYYCHISKYVVAIAALELNIHSLPLPFWHCSPLTYMLKYVL
jgi:hypothetical protein